MNGFDYGTGYGFREQIHNGILPDVSPPVGAGMTDNTTFAFILPDASIGISTWPFTVTATLYA